MPLEVKIITGSRAGQVERFEKANVVIGRQDDADLKFDAHKDLDVSAIHAEIRTTGIHVTVHDHNSTNGTFVNGERVQLSAELFDGDTIMFGRSGPKVEIKTGGRKRTPSTAVSPVKKTPSTAIGAVKKGSTEERVRVAVREQTAGLKRYLIASVIVVVVGLGAAYYLGNRESATQVEKLKQQLAANDTKVTMLQGGMSGDTALGNELQRQLKALKDRVATAKNDEERKRIEAEIAQLQGRVTAIVQMDLPAINTANAPAVALVVSEIAGKPFAGTAFAISNDGAMLTNRHNVLNEDGQTATRLVVKFRDSGDWIPAKVLKVAKGDDGDLALIQVDTTGRTIPVVAGIQSSNTNAGEGASVALIGFPLGYSTAQEGEELGNNFIAKTTLNGGTVSKRTSTVLQIDSFAGHGSSGSPVFNARGLVVGVVWGGQTEAQGRIVYAVPPEKVAAFVPAAYRGVVKE